MKWFRRHIIFTNLALIGVEVGGAFLIWFTLGERQTFGPLNTYAIACFSIVIASIAALNSMLASSIASDTQRPFIYMDGSIDAKQVGEYITLKFNIKNSGTLPAEDLQIDTQFFDEDEEITEKNPGSKYVPIPVTPATILFPNSEIYRKYILELKLKNDLELWSNIQQGKTKCRMRITYTSLGRKHKTIQTEKLAKREWEETIVITPIPPQKWE